VDCRRANITAPIAAVGSRALAVIIIPTGPAFCSGLLVACANRIPIAAMAASTSATVGFTTKTTAGVPVITNAVRRVVDRIRTVVVRTMAWAKAMVAVAAIAAPACLRRICTFRWKALA
jgi:hypothetical protein